MKNKLKPWKESQCGTCKYSPETCPFIESWKGKFVEGMSKLIDILYSNGRCYHRRKK